MSQFASLGLGTLGNLARSVSVRTPESFELFKALCQQKAEKSTYQLAADITSNVPQYDLPKLGARMTASGQKQSLLHELQDEWYRVLNSGPGVLVLKGFVTDMAALEGANEAFDKIIEAEKANAKGDHFATGGANSRIWNSFQKHAERDPASFVPYYANPWLARISEAWLGPGYQVTAQVNIVRPGGKPQNPHRDYHLGFLLDPECPKFPRSMQLASQYLTLQGGVAHSEMPLESGPTRVLPFSQLLPEGYLTWRKPEYEEYFKANWVSLPMQKGDAIFFNPALMHAAGENTSADVHRSANLLQVSSAFGRAMETVDGVKIVRRCWNELKALYARRMQETSKSTNGVNGTMQNGHIIEEEDEMVAACVNAMAEWYPFPSNLDLRPPRSGGAPPAGETDVLWEGLKGDWDMERVIGEMELLRKDSAS